jgi:hypothetical protein|nr:MAG TPA: hypothetical protein [Caudoviricetes sp.]
MSKDLLKNIIDLIPDEDIDTIYKVVVKFIPEDKPTQDEIKAIEEAKEDSGELIDHNNIDWN